MPVQVKVNAGPGPFDGLVTQAGANRVQFDVSPGSEQVIFIHDKGVKSLLPKVTLPIMIVVNASCITGMCRAQ